MQHIKPLAFFTQGDAFKLFEVQIDTIALRDNIKISSEKNHLTISEFSADLKIRTHVLHLWHAPSASFNALHLHLNLTTLPIGLHIFFPFGTVHIGLFTAFSGWLFLLRFVQGHLSREPAIVDLFSQSFAVVSGDTNVPFFSFPLHRQELCRTPRRQSTSLS